jgi:predicted PhzF superfamily epimerase YddE/YHI9
MELTVYQINAFSDQISGGNPACIIPLETWLPAETMLAVAKKKRVAGNSIFY